MHHRIFRALAIVVLASSIFIPRAASAAALSSIDGCPHVYSHSYFAASDSYAIVFASPVAATAALHFTLYTAKATYVIDAPIVPVDTPMALAFEPYRSKPVVISTIPDDPYLGFTAQPRIGNISCPLLARGFFKSNYPKNEFDPTAFERGYDGAVADETSKSDVLRPVAGPGLALTCKQPWVEATTDVKADVSYPAAAVALHAGGVAADRVFLDSDGGVRHVTLYSSTGNGDLDATAADAAERTTYKPEIAACMPVAGSYLFVVDFIK